MDKNKEFTVITIDESASIDPGTTFKINLNDTVYTSTATMNSYSYDTITAGVNIVTSTNLNSAPTTFWTDYITTDNKEFVDVMPEMSMIKEMCDIYPGMKKAFEYFKDTYDLIKDDYEARKKTNG